MRRQFGLLSSTLLAVVSTARALPHPPPPPEPPPPMRVEVKSGEGNQSMVFVTSGGEGSHVLKLQLEDGKVVVEAEPNPDRPWMGVLLDDSKAMGGADGERSLEVLSVADGSPAQRGGLRKGDAITGIDGKTLAQRGGRPLFEGVRPGDRVKLDVLRDGKRIQVPIQLTSRPARVEFEETEGMNAFALAGDSLQGLAGLEALASLKGLARIPCPEGAKCPTGFMFETGAPPRLGVIIEEMPEQLARFFGTEPGKGMLVKEVIKDSAAEKAGLEAGDVILRIGKTEVSSASDIAEALDSVAKDGDLEIEVLRRGERRVFRGTLPEATRRGDLLPLQFTMPQFTMPEQLELERLSEAIAEAQSRATREVSAEALAQALASVEKARAEIERSRADVQREMHEVQASARRQMKDSNADVTRELERVRERLREESKRQANPSGMEDSRETSPSATRGGFQRAPTSPTFGGSAYIAQ